MLKQGPDFHFEITAVIRNKRVQDNEVRLYMLNSFSQMQQHALNKEA